MSRIYRELLDYSLACIRGVLTPVWIEDDDLIVSSDNAS